jgi:DNA-binding transcriptional MerR regulator
VAVRIGDLSRLAGVPVATIKYYLREGLLPPGELTSPNQARYGDAHLRRLRLVRALIDVGGLSVTTTRRVLEQIASPEVGVRQMLGKVQYALTTPRERVRDERWTAAAREATDLVEHRRWQVRPTNPAWDTLTELLVTLRELGQDDILELLETYAECAERLAAADVALIARRPDIDSMLEGLVVDAILGDRLIHALRRLAQEDASGRALDPPSRDG